MQQVNCFPIFIQIKWGKVIIQDACPFKAKSTTYTLLPPQSRKKGITCGKAQHILFFPKLRNEPNPVTLQKKKHIFCINSSCPYDYLLSLQFSVNYAACVLNVQKYFLHTVLTIWQNWCGTNKFMICFDLLPFQHAVVDRCTKGASKLVPLQWSTVQAKTIFCDILSLHAK